MHWTWLLKRRQHFPYAEATRWSTQSWKDYSSSRPGPQFIHHLLHMATSVYEVVASSSTALPHGLPPHDSTPLKGSPEQRDHLEPHSHVHTDHQYLTRLGSRRSVRRAQQLPPILNDGQGIKHLAASSGHVIVSDGTKLYYEVYEAISPATSAAATAQAEGTEVGGTARPQGSDRVANVVMVMGYAAGRDAWLPVIDHWMREAAHSEQLHHLSARFAIFDNRGIGSSDTPPAISSYTTTVMAKDTLAVMDHLGWRRAHLVGFSMGGMVSMKLAAHRPDRVLSLTVLGVTGGGWQVLPLQWSSMRLLLWAAFGARTPRDRAHVDVHFHYCKETLHKMLPPMPSHPEPRRVEAALIDEYVATATCPKAPPQPAAGNLGQLYALFMHKMTEAEVQDLCEAPFPVKLMHGHHDQLAMPRYGEAMARRLQGTFVLVNGGHYITRECAPDVCMHLADTIASVPPEDYDDSDDDGHGDDEALVGRKIVKWE